MKSLRNRVIIVNFVNMDKKKNEAIFEALSSGDLTLIRKIVR